jgi:alkaline phosphatase D
MSTLSRRDFIKLLLASSSTIVVSSGLQGCQFNSDSPVNVAFNYGVASGDPLANSVVIWTRVSVDNAQEVIVNWQVATDTAFSKLVNQSSATVNKATDHTLKVDVTGLQAGTTYYYRFMVDNNYSVVGTTKTLPANPSSVNLAVFSCANFPAGFFHAYGYAAQMANNFDAVVHVGDYIYEYDKAGYPDAGTGEAINRVHSPVTECIRLEDYRQRYAQYRSDANLQKLHAAAPFICIWDDHEFANDAYKDGAENHNANEGSWTDRKLAAMQAWYEWLPVRAPVVDQERIKIYRRFDFGSLVSLMMLDTRIIGRDKQLDYANYMSQTSGFNALQFANDMENRDRSLLGLDQRSWLQSQLQDSVGRGVRWQVLGQQILMGKTWIPASIIMPDPKTGLPNPQNLANYQLVATAYQALATAVVTRLTQDGSIGNYASKIPGFATMSPSNQAIALTETVKQSNASLYGQIFSSLSNETQTALVTYGALLDPAQNPSIPYNLDAWDGYAVEREILYATAKALNANLVVLSGDTHNAWAINLVDQNAQPVGVEFAGPAVSSPGLEKYLSIPKGAEASTEVGIMQLVSGIKYFNISQRGFMVVSFDDEKATCKWFLMPREAEKLSETPTFLEAKSMSVNQGQKILS